VTAALFICFYTVNMGGVTHPRLPMFSGPKAKSDAIPLFSLQSNVFIAPGTPEREELQSPSSSHSN
jgi:hypothetical protein